MIGEHNRRRFIKVAGAGIAAAPLGSLLLGGAAHAQDLPQLEESDPTATALEYAHQSAKDGQLCNNCQLYQGEADAEWGPCPLFPGKAVAGKGWCKSWVVKAG